MVMGDFEVCFDVVLLGQLLEGGTAEPTQLLLLLTAGRHPGGAAAAGVARYIYRGWLRREEEREGVSMR